MRLNILQDLKKMEHIVMVFVYFQWKFYKIF